MNEYNPLKLITSTPEWLAVEQTLETFITDMFDLRKIDTKLPAEEYKTECIARLRAAENVALFYRTNHFISKKTEDMQASFR